MLKVVLFWLWLLWLLWLLSGSCGRFLTCTAIVFFPSCFFQLPNIKPLLRLTSLLFFLCPLLLSSYSPSTFVIFIAFLLFCMGELCHLNHLYNNCFLFWLFLSTPKPLADNTMSLFFLCPLLLSSYSPSTFVISFVLSPFPAPSPSPSPSPSFFFFFFFFLSISQS